MVDRYSAKKMPGWYRTRERALGREALPETALGAWRVGKRFSPEKFLYDRILGRPPVVDRYSAKKMPWWYRSRERALGGEALPETALGAWRVGKDFPQNSLCTIEYWGDPR